VYGGDAVSGRSLAPVVDEMLRRHGWQKQNDPLAIAYERVPSDDHNPPDGPF
jgi:hypothetical protein